MAECQDSINGAVPGFYKWRSARISEMAQCQDFINGEVPGFQQWHSARIPEVAQCQRNLTECQRNLTQCQLCCQPGNLVQLGNLPTLIFISSWEGGYLGIYFICLEIILDGSKASHR